MYAANLAWWLEWFPPENVLVISWDDVREDALAVVQRILKFADVEWEIDDVLRNRVKPVRHKGRWIGVLMTKTSSRVRVVLQLLCLQFLGAELVLFALVVPLVLLRSLAWSVFCTA